jgi:hypothetical protein
VAQAVEDTFTAIAFAEAGEFEPAASFINKDGDAPKPRRAGYPPGDLTSFAPAGLKM